MASGTDSPLLLGQALIDYYVRKRGACELTDGAAKEIGGSELERLLLEHALVFSDIGGSVTNTALRLQRYGVAPLLLACIGDDARGEFYGTRIKEEGIASCLQRGEQTGYVVTVDGDAFHACGYNYGCANDVRLGEAEARMVRHASLVYSSGYQFIGSSNAIRFVRAARSFGVPVYIDGGGFGMLEPAVIEGLLEAADTLLLNEREARVLKRHPSSLGCTVVVKHGAQPTELYVAGTRTLHEVPGAALINDIGAGDAFAAGYVAARLRSASPQEAVDEGQVAAAQVVSSLRFN